MHDKFRLNYIEIMNRAFYDDKKKPLDQNARTERGKCSHVRNEINKGDEIIQPMLHFHRLYNSDLCYI